MAGLSRAAEANTTLSSLAAFTGRTLTISDGTGSPSAFSARRSRRSLFSLLGTPPALGRDFTEADDRAGAERVVLLSDEVWQLRHNADRAIIGRSISINALRND